jgi:uncharacterized protein (DUF924 family)
MKEDVLDFWLSAEAKPLWFEKQDAFDAVIRRRFAPLVEAAIRGELDEWAETADGALALLLLLDQFTRNIHRGRPEAFSGDAKAREIADRAISRGYDQQIPREHRFFFYLPFEHSEQLCDQVRSVQLFAALGIDDQLDYAVRHHVIIERFGRFPHRNAVLGRASTAEETAFLTLPESSF